jgi:triphosphoribosyl-dephospho-CoA synthase
MLQPEEQARFPLGVAATLAIVREVTAPKPGNVHRGADFDDVTYEDFIDSAVVIGPIVERTPELGVGRAVLETVQATRDAVATNTNLGTLLLLVPLAAVPPSTALAPGIRDLLMRLTAEDTRHVYEAIRIASAGGLGRTAEADVFDARPPQLNLVDAMRLAADRDLVARQYTNAFSNVFNVAADIEEGAARGWPINTAIVHAHLRQMANEPDSLIRRKCGDRVAEESSARAARAIDAGQPGKDAYQRAVEDLDFWLRSDGHRRNPGTTADLIAAGLFVLLREGRVKSFKIGATVAVTPERPPGSAGGFKGVID